MKTRTLSRIHGTQAATIFSRGKLSGTALAPVDFEADAGFSVSFPLSFQILFGCQNLRRTSSATMEQIEATISTSHGPWKFETRYCGMAKATPATSAAGQTS